MMRPTDQLDISILDSENPGCSISHAIRPFLIERSESVLRTRVRALALRKLVRVVPTKHTQNLYSVPVVEDLEKSDRCPVSSAPDGATNAEPRQAQPRSSYD
jgi:hypothetical protein